MSEAQQAPRKSRREALLEIKDLTIDFDTADGWVRGLHGVDFRVCKGEILGLVGESGSGKSITCMAVMRLLGPRARVRGHVRYHNQDLLGLDDKGINQMRGGEIAMIFQDPMSSLNPIQTIGRQIVESVTLNPGKPIGKQMKGAVKRHQGLTGIAAWDESIRLLGHVGIPEPEHRMTEYPHQLSGGMNQRAMIAMALAGRPTLLIADEPTTALDVTIQAQVLELIRRLRDEMQMSIILITHDLGVVAETCDRVAVMYAGRIVEKGPVSEVFETPYHPYTRGLLESLPRIDRKTSKLKPIRGTVPAPHELPEGCAFEPRCQYALEECKTDQPLSEALPGDRSNACFNPQQTRLET